MQSEKRTLSRRYLENYFSGVWKSIAGGDNDHREGGRRGERANLSDRPMPTFARFLSLPLLLAFDCIFLFSLVYLSDQYPDSEQKRKRKEKRQWE